MQLSDCSSFVCPRRVCDSCIPADRYDTTTIPADQHGVPCKVEGTIATHLHKVSRSTAGLLSCLVMASTTALVEVKQAGVAQPSSIREDTYGEYSRTFLVKKGIETD